MHCPGKPGPSKRPGIEVADVVRLVADDFLGSALHTAWQKKALLDILTCRTRAMGGHVMVCDHCAHEVPAYNSCRNRHCPKCQSLAQARWIEQRKQRVLPTHHFHLVFTLPAQLRSLAKKHPRPVYNLLIKAAAETLKTIAEDPHHLGATPTITTVLHTWTRELQLHPHLHVIISGGGLTRDGRWIATKEDFLFPVQVLSCLFRGKFLAGIRRLVQRGEVVPPETMNTERLLRRLSQIKWVVYAKRTFGEAEQVFEYLGHYTHRVAISNQRLKRLTPKAVNFFTKDGKDCTLTPREFVRRFLLHILPRGFTKIRHFGLLAPCSVKTRLVTARALLEEAGSAPVDADQPPEIPDAATDQPQLCPRCKKGRLSISIRVEPVPRRILAAVNDTS
jgi:hypothetical protein